MKKTHAVASLAILAAGVLLSATARAGDDPWEVRLRALYLSPANDSDAFAPLGIPQNAIHINDKWLPELDFEYYFAPHWSSELVLTYPQLQRVTVEKSALGGPTTIGTFRHLPPVLTLKYGFLPNSDFRPYIGAGLNVTIISDVNLTVPTVGRLDLDRTSVGPAAQAGFDWKFAEHWFFNVDAKWVMLRSDVKFDGVKISEARVDPFLVGIGIGYRFGGGASAPAPVAYRTTPPPSEPTPPPAAAAPVAAPPPPPPAPAVAPPTRAAEMILKGVNFETDSSVLRPESTRALDEVVVAIKRCHCTKVQIRGYTDSVGSARYNQRLSERRAQAVRKYLVDHGVSADRLSAQGLGEADPVASNATPAGRAENRRVTVQFTSGAER